MKTIPNYHPPQDYRRPTKTQEKVYVPVNDYPEINFSEIANPLTFLTVFMPLLVRNITRNAFISRWMTCQFLASSNSSPSPCFGYWTIPLDWHSITGCPWVVLLN